MNDLGGRLSGPERAAASGAANSALVFLHGYGADGSDLIGLAGTLAPHLPDTRFLAPNAPQPSTGNPGGFQWFPIPWLDGSSETEALAAMAQSFALLHHWLDDLEQAGTEPQRTLLCGFSQGTMMALHIGLRRKQPLAGIIGFSGRLLMPEKLAAEAVSKPPVLLVHGDADPVVPFASLEAAAQALRAAGVETSTHVSKGVGHGIAPDGLGLALGFARERLGITR